MTLPLRLCVRRTADEGQVLVTVRVPSHVDCIEEAVDLVTRHCLAGVTAPPRMRFRLQVALSEALANAIIRGNREDSHKWVYVRAELGDQMINLHVTDEGDGFDPDTIPDACRAEALLESSGRGLYLIRHLVDDVRFNDRGNSICMTLRRLGGGSTTSSAASPG